MNKAMGSSVMLTVVVALTVDRPSPGGIAAVTLLVCLVLISLVLLAKGDD